MAEKEDKQDGLTNSAGYSGIIESWTFWDPREKLVSNKNTSSILKTYDILLNFVLFTPMIILHCQTINGILDLLFLRQFPERGLWFLLFLGISIEFLMCYMHKALLNKVPKENMFYQTLASHMFVYYLAFANNCHIRAVGDLYALYVGTDWLSSIMAVSTGLTLLIGLKSVKNLMGPPLTLTVDTHDHEEVFNTSTLFGTEADLSFSSAMDSFATVAVAHSLVHFTWSGWWGFLDTQLSPDNPAWSCIYSIILGYAGCLVVILGHGFACNISKRLQGDENDTISMRLLFEDIYHIFAGLSVITAWRGFWYGFYVIGEQYPVLNDNKDACSIVAHALSFMFLIIANVSMSLPGKGVDIDGKNRDGSGIVCDVNYLCHYVGDKQESTANNNTKKTQ